MKNLLKLAFIFTVMVAFVACNNNDDDEPDNPTPSCSATIDDWTGVYEGTVDCDGGGTSRAIVTEQGSGIKIVLTADYGSVTTETEIDVTPNGCNINDTQSGLGLTLTIEGSLSGATLTIKETLSDGSTSDVCNYTLTRTSDDPPACQQSDWLGSFSGTQVCGMDPAKDATVTFSEDNFDDLEIEIVIDENPGTSTSTFGGGELFGCEYSVDPFFGEDLTATLDGDNLTVTQGECTITATRD